MDRAELTALVRATGCAVERGGAVFLCAGDWTAAERAEAEALMARPADAATRGGGGWLCIRTGGTGGGVRFARHDERTLGAAVGGCVAFFGLGRVNAVDVLPPHHVSGLMARVRCAATGGRHLAWSWKDLEAGRVPALPAGDWVISLVPTQLQRLLQVPAAFAWLRRLALIFVGGGPLWPDLADAAAADDLRVAPVYGMTETAAMVAGLLPDEFLAGERSAGRPLPHARVVITSEGVVRVAGESIHRGYWPEWSDATSFTTEDLGRIDARGHLFLHGRRDAVIITGGKKVQPADVEAALRAHGEFTDLAVIGVPDPEWGEVVVACFPAAGTVPDLERAVAALAPHQRPKRFVALATWPRTAQGKVNRAALRAAVLATPGQTARG
ncbi:MAG: AMP-binding protein [Opitutaceae bacterium]|nr:AMP-binding protein [Opitutaceae bacterium]